MSTQTAIAVIGALFVIGAVALLVIEDNKRDSAIEELLNTSAFDKDLEDILGSVEIYRVQWIQNNTVREALVGYDSSSKGAFFIRETGG